MAVLETIRNKFGVLITVLIAVALLSFIIDPSVFNSCTRGNGDVAEINGQKVSYMEYQKEMEEARIAIEAANGVSLSNEQLQGFVWEKMLDSKAFFSKYEDAGISVTNDEIYSMLQANPDYSQLVSMKKENPTVKCIWDNRFYQFRKYSFMNKYNSALVNSSFSNPLQIANEMGDKSFKTEYVMLPIVPSAYPDIKVTDEEIEAYYNTHKSEFKLPAQAGNLREVKLAVFDIVPSAEDIQIARDRISDLRKELATRPYDEFLETKYYKDGEFESIKGNEFIFRGKGEVSEVIEAGDSMYVIRVLDTKTLPDSLKLKILPALSDNVSDTLFKDVQAFPVSVSDMNARFNDPYTIASNEVNKPFIVTGKDNNKYLLNITDKMGFSVKKRISYVKETAFVSSETDSEISEKANEFYDKVTDYETFNTALSELGQNDMQHTVMLSKDMYDINQGYGLNIRNARDIVKWAFDAKEGAISNILSMDSKYVVAALKSINNTGYASLESVKDRISYMLLNEKVAKALAEDVRAKISGIQDMAAIAGKLEEKLNTDNIIFSYDGRVEPKFQGAVCGSETGKVYGPFVGNFGVYVYKVVSTENRTPITEEDIARNNQMYMNYIFSNIQNELYESVEVEDNRIKFM